MVEYNHISPDTVEDHIGELVELQGVPRGFGDFEPNIIDRVFGSGGKWCAMIYHKTGEKTTAVFPYRYSSGVEVAMNHAALRAAGETDTVCTFRGKLFYKGPPILRVYNYVVPGALQYRMPFG